MWTDAENFVEIRTQQIRVILRAQTNEQSDNSIVLSININTTIYSTDTRSLGTMAAQTCWIYNNVARNKSDKMVNGKWLPIL